MPAVAKEYTVEVKIKLTEEEEGFLSEIIKKLGIENKPRVKVFRYILSNLPELLYKNEVLIQKNEVLQKKNKALTSKLEKNRKS